MKILQVAMVFALLDFLHGWYVRGLATQRVATAIGSRAVYQGLLVAGLLLAMENTWGGALGALVGSACGTAISTTKLIKLKRGD